MAKVFIQNEQENNPRLTNTTGADITKDDFVVIGGICLVANEDVADGEVGSFHSYNGSIIQIDADNDGVTGELTFGTANADVFWKAATSEFSDTSTAGYIKIGSVVEVKNAAGMVTVRLTSNTSTVA